MTAQTTCYRLPPAPKSPHQHPLVLTAHPYGASMGWVCNKCSTSYGASIPSNHCGACHFDLCASCVTNLNTMPCVPPPSQNPFHIHPLVLTRPYGGMGWTCNKCGVHHNGNDLANHCQMCRYDLCADCIRWNAIPTIA